jgi:hypothetical protein
MFPTPPPVHPVTAPVGSVNPLPAKWALLELEYVAGVNIVAPPFCERRLERECERRLEREYEILLLRR